MSRVWFLELETHPKLRVPEKKIAAALDKMGLSGISVRLFQDQAGRIGYSMCAASGGKKALDVIHRLVWEMLGDDRDSR